jgi:Autographiviridae RNA polymerase
MNDQEWDALLERQRELEDNALALGGERFRRRVEQANAAGKGSTEGAAKKLLSDAIQPLEDAITEMIDRKGAGRRHMAVKWCALAGADVAAFITAKCVLDGMLIKESFAKRASSVSQLILDELRYRRFREQAPALFEYKMNKFQTSSYAHMARSLNATIKFADVDVSGLEMSVNEKVQVGAKLIDLFIQTTGLVREVSHTRVSHKNGSGKPMDQVMLEPTPETLEWLTKRNNALELLAPVNLPMIMPPMAWSAERRGGYRFALRGKYPLVRGISKEHSKKIQETAIPLVYNAVNHIQNTAWRINTDVFDVVHQIHRRGGELAGIPAYDEEPLPAKPEDIDTNDVARKQWRKAAAAVKERNHKRAVQALEVSKITSTAALVLNEEAIYFPYNLDFRGRVYPVSNYLSPQGSDLSRALLTFAQGKPLGVDGSAWLAIHGANCLGEYPGGLKFSRMTFIERVEWIQAHTREIQQVANDPFSALWWTLAEKPLQFYAFCVEWDGFTKMYEQGKGDEYVCSLPIAQDGSCNGLQHFSAMLRDPIGGKAVNLIPQDRPQDIYQIIADKVLDSLEKKSATDAVAALWLTSGLVTRKLVKRPSMTFGYGSKKYGFANQTQEYLKGLENWQEVKALFTGADGKSLVPAACKTMSVAIWDALGECVVAAFLGMAWLQQAVRRVIISGRPVEWTVPLTGFPVRQEYFKTKKRLVETILAGKVFKAVIHDATDKVEIYKQSNAIAPNFIHSLDAAALMLTVNQAADEGVESFGMIHDSYATAPGDCNLLARATRQSFVKLYQNSDVIDNLYKQFQAQMEKPEDCPIPPTMGTLDVGGVLASDYFFA